MTSCYEKSLVIIKNNLKELDLIAESLRVLEILTSEQIKYIDENMQLPPEVIKTKADIKAQQAKQAAQEKAQQTTKQTGTNDPVKPVAPKEATKTADDGEKIVVTSRKQKATAQKPAREEQKATAVVKDDGETITVTSRKQKPPKIDNDTKKSAPKDDIDPKKN